jgi:hypothetical protein
MLRGHLRISVWAVCIFLLFPVVGCRRDSGPAADLAEYEGKWTGADTGPNSITEVVFLGASSPCPGKVTLQGTTHTMGFEVVWRLRDGQVVGLYGKKGEEAHVLAEVRLTDGTLSGQVTMAPEFAKFFNTMPSKYSFSGFTKAHRSETRKDSGS